MQKKLGWLLLFVVLINCIAGFLLVPYAQESANSHMNSGPFFGTLFYIASIIVLLKAGMVTPKQKNKRMLLFCILSALSLFYWGFQLYSLYCQGCANSG